jgi:hypothetical protein
MLMELKEVKRTNPMRSKNMHDSRESNERCTNPNTDVHIQSIIHKAQVIFFFFFILKKGVISNAQGFRFCGESI